MKEYPILFSGPMVRAILGGHKTQTRRIVKPQPPCGCRYVINGAGNAALCQSMDYPEIWVQPTARSVDHRLRCPYGNPGDRLWVRETTHFEEDGGWKYSADNAIVENGVYGYSRYVCPSIHMRKSASRITLEITKVRVERLHAISKTDAEAEGIENCVITSSGRRQNPVWKDYAQRKYDPFEWFSSPFYSYKSLWESINGPVSWDENPWVWVIEFRRVAT